VDGSQGKLLQALSRKIARTRRGCDRVLFTTGLGLSDSREIPLRLPAIMVPALHAMERQQYLALCKPSKYLVYQATDFIADANGIDHSVAIDTSKRMEDFLRQYVELIHPNIAENVEFRFERDRNEDSTRAIEELVDEISGEITHEIHQRLLFNESSHSNRNGQALRYAAANVLYNGAEPDRYPFKDCCTDIDVIIPIGGKAEKPFFTLTTAVAKKRGVDVVPMITQIGAKPTYYSASDGNATRRDFAALEADGASIELLRSFNTPMQ
ncbi:MAG: hypothetical protein QF442_03570, partial [Candidatus Peribacteraceae bacterium]|nr:hypothetical protein [Candidatus Peribacteraceae bacterium]